MPLLDHRKVHAQHAVGVVGADPVDVDPLPQVELAEERSRLTFAGETLDAVVVGQCALCANREELPAAIGGSRGRLRYCSCSGSVSSNSGSRSRNRLSWRRRYWVIMLPMSGSGRLESFEVWFEVLFEAAGDSEVMVLTSG